MSIQMLKILIDSACLDGIISDQDRKLIEQKAQQTGVSKDAVEKMINEALANTKNTNQHNESGFISVEDIETPPPPPPIKDVKIETKEQSKFTDLKPLSTQGAMSIVSQAKLHGKWIIIKRIKPEFKNNPKYKELFMREFENAYHLDHPHIVRLLDKGEDADGLFYTMEYVDGRPLSELMTPTGIGNQLLAENIMRQLLDALSYVHKKQIIHRDLKPDNIYVTFRGDNVKVLDFGLAAADYFEDDLLKVGTPRYASPEQMQKGFSADQRADIYSFGKIFLELLTGKIEESAVESIQKPVYKHIIKKSIAQNPNNRFYNCDEIINLFNNPQLVVSEEVKQPEIIKPENKNPQINQPKNENNETVTTKKIPWLWIIIAVVVLGGIGSYFIFFNKGGSILGGGEKDLIARADSFYNAGLYVDANKIYNNIEKKNEHVTQRINELKEPVSKYNEAEKFFTDKNIARAKTYLEDILKTSPNFVDAKKKKDECDKIIKGINFNNLQVAHESSSNLYGLEDDNGYVVIDYQFEKIAPVVDWHKKGLIPVEIDGKYGFIDKNKNYFAKCEYSASPGSFTGKYKWIGNGFVVHKNGKDVTISVDENGNGGIK